jgi:hypothetical protein
MSPRVIFNVGNGRQADVLFWVLYHIPHMRFQPTMASASQTCTTGEGPEGGFEQCPMIQSLM